jgi:hypothetical protein
VVSLNTFHHLLDPIGAVQSALGLLTPGISSCPPRCGLVHQSISQANISMIDHELLRLRLVLNFCAGRGDGSNPGRSC